MNGIWIRSQDQNRLIFATNIYIDDYGSFVLIKANSHTIAEYTTKERALQVLDEIQGYIACGTTEVYEGETDTWRKYGVVYIMPDH